MFTMRRRRLCAPAIRRAPTSNAARTIAPHSLNAGKYSTPLPPTRPAAEAFILAGWRAAWGLRGNGIRALMRAADNAARTSTSDAD